MEIRAQKASSSERRVADTVNFLDSASLEHQNGSRPTPR